MSKAIVLIESGEDGDVLEESVWPWVVLCRTSGT
jgi:hypothetical protein